MYLVLFSLPELDSKHVQWVHLSFHAKNFWVEVSTDIQFRSLQASDLDTVLLASPKGTPIKPQTPQPAEMTITTTIDPSFRSPLNIHNKIWFNPEDATALGRVRLRRGDDHFKKMYRFTDQGVFRHRIEPKNDKEATLGPERWTDIKNSFYPYDLTRLGCSFVSERSLLVFILSAVDFSKNNEKLSLGVFGKRQLHRVQIQKQGLRTLSVNYIEKKQQTTVRKQGKIEALKISIGSEPIDSGLKEPENFSFLGFQYNYRYLYPARRRQNQYRRHSLGLSGPDGANNMFPGEDEPAPPHPRLQFDDRHCA
jgi:hypothetical protein